MFWLFFLGLPIVGGLVARLLRNRPYPRPVIGLGIMASLAIISWAVLGARTLGAVPGFLVAAALSSTGFFSPDLGRVGSRYPRVVLVINGLMLLVAVGLWASHNPGAASRFWDGLNASGLVGLGITIALFYAAYRLIFGRNRRH